jgi:hypothetical protein
MLLPHGPSQLQWDDIYPHWQADDLKYYWEKYDNPIVPRDMSYAEKGFAEALAMAKAGNEHAIYRLKRTIRNNPDAPESETARTVLQEMGIL